MKRPSSPDPSPAVARRKLGDEVLDRLLEMIERREIEPGGQLPSERDLMTRFGVGRPAVREALQSLAGMGLIQIQQGERARLTVPDPRGVLDQIDLTVRHLLQNSPQTREHLREARLMFEVGMVRIAAERATPADIQKLEQALKWMEASRSESAQFMAADMSFHTAIASIAGNPICEALSDALLQWLFGFFPRTLHAPGRQQLTVDEHRAILAAITKHSPEEAARNMTIHLTRTNPLYGEPETRSRTKA